MNERGKEFLKAYLDNQGNQRLRKYLSASFLKEIDQVEEVFIPTHFSNFDPIEKIHWSWFLAILDGMTEQEKKIYIGCLPERGFNALSENFKVEPEKSMTDLGKMYARSQLYTKLLGQQPEPKPPECLSPSPLNALLDLSKQDLLHLIHFLCLFDLGVEIRQIVETKILKKIYSFLTDEEKEILKNVSSLKEGGPLPKMGLDRWDGTQETLRHLLHKRGLQRLAIGLSGASFDLIWHIAHQLDCGRGGTLLKTVSEEMVPNWTDATIRHIEEWLRK